jgi:hypothetical protein
MGQTNTGIHSDVSRRMHFTGGRCKASRDGSDIESGGC